MMEVEATSDLLLPDGRPMGVLNFSPVVTGEIAGDPSVKKLVDQLGGWIEKSRERGPNGNPGMFNRSLYVTPDNPYDQMRVARHAVRDDDMVAGLAEATEALAFNGGLKWEAENLDDADVFNQLSADLNLDGKIREMWREEFTVDQFVCAKLWDTVEYTVRGNTEQGNKKKKKYTFYAPARLVLLQSEHCVPIGYGPLREDNQAWQATPNEIGTYNQITFGGETQIDPLMTAFFTGIYAPGIDEQAQLSHWGVNCERLLAMRPDWVFRHTNTRPDFQKFADIRLKAAFNLLDLKRQLMASDRAMLIGAANYILLIRKGSDAAPATQEEVVNLKQNYNFIAKLPVIISDHRLDIEIIAPKLDFVLNQNAYDTIDIRMLHSILSTFPAPGRSSQDAASTFSDVLASGLQNRRHMIKRTLEKEIARAIVNHPKNKNIFDAAPSLAFTPREVAVGVNQFTLTALLALRTQREISRDTILEYMGLDEATEAQRMEMEEKFYDDIFKTQIPFTAAPAGGAPPAPAKPAATGPSGPSGAAAAKKAAPAAPPANGTNSSAGSGQPAKKTANSTPEAPSVSGARGGRPAGGGTSKQSPAAQTKPKTANGNPSTKKG